MAGTGVGLVGTGVASRNARSNSCICPTSLCRCCLGWEARAVCADLVAVGAGSGVHDQGAGSGVREAWAGSGVRVEGGVVSGVREEGVVVSGVHAEVVVVSGDLS